MHDIVLTTLNARYIHSAFGLRYLQANLHELRERSVLLEFVLDVKPEDAAEAILAQQPKIVGFSVYIWNVVQTERIVRLLRAIAPQIKIVLGGPEVSYEIEEQSIVQLADHVVTGWGEKSFYDLCGYLLQCDVAKANEDSSQDAFAKIVVGQQLPLAEIELPYDLYNSDDVANRLIYVEASRGCPYKCEFCLSALDKTAWPFELERFLSAMEALHARGVRHFKFVDRTFNLNIKTSLKILDFFLERMSDDLFLHFEVIPDHLPDALKQKIQAFPEGCLQFEIGIQTFNAEVQARISRKQINAVAQENLRWIRTHSNAYIHADLIYGLPGEDLASFAMSFNTLYALQPHEIQVGILKRLKGSPIVRHTVTHQMVFNPNPPFNIVQNDVCSFAEVQRINRFARYWDLLANSGRFRDTLPLLLEEAPFEQFLRISDVLFARTQQTHKIALLKLFDLVAVIAVEDLGLDIMRVHTALERDFQRSGLKSLPQFLLAGEGQLGRPDSHKSRQRAARQARRLDA